MWLRKLTSEGIRGGECGFSWLVEGSKMRNEGEAPRQ